MFVFQLPVRLQWPLVGNVRSNTGVSVLLLIARPIGLVLIALLSRLVWQFFLKLLPKNSAQHSCTNGQHRMVAILIFPTIIFCCPLTPHTCPIVSTNGKLPLFLVAIVIVFTFCWSPFHAQRLFFIYASLYSDWSDLIRQINSILFLTAGKLSSY